MVEGPPHRRQAREHVVAVDPQAGDPESGRASRDRVLGLHGDRLRDRPVVVLTDEHDGAWYEAAKIIASFTSP